MSEYEAPLLEIFNRLREAGLLLGVDEYQLVLKSLQGGFGINNKDSLKRLCQTLWVKSAEEKWIFEYHFEQVLDSHFFSDTSASFLHSTSKLQKFLRINSYLILFLLGLGIAFSLGILLQMQPFINQQVLTPNIQPAVTTTQQTKNSFDWKFWSLLTFIVSSVGYVILWKFKPNSEEHISQTLSLIELKIIADIDPLPCESIDNTEDDELVVTKALMKGYIENKNTTYSDFILSNEYFPVTERQAKQIWRYLRHVVREGQATELDIDATVSQIGNQGLLVEPVLLPRRVNKAEMLLLIDQDGSMVPFHRLSQMLAKTALRDSRFGKTGVYYFHNCPTDYLYRDPNHQEAESINDILTNFCSERVSALIFSDAGAARGGYSEERYQSTKKFLDQLKLRIRYIAWLNPVPKERWLGTTSAEIARFVPMFEFSRRGMQDTIGVLRGRPTNFEGHRK